MAKRSCATCEWSEIHTTLGAEGALRIDWAECRRLAPTPAYHTHLAGRLRASWPVVVPDDWCGEYRERDDEEADDASK